MVTGRVREESLVFTSVVRTRESSRENTFATRSSKQRDLGTVLSTTRTRSFTVKFLLFSSHLLRCCKVGTNSRTHRDQNQLTRNCACLHCLREYIFSLAKTPGGMARFRLCRSRWFGVSGSMSLGSSLAGEMGRLFRIDVTSANTVRRVSKGIAAPGLLKTAFIALRTLLISLSQTPDMWLAVGGWKRHLSKSYLNQSASYECSSLLICTSFSSRTERRSSLSASVKFVPLSDQISLGQPRTEMNRRRAKINVSVSKELTSSMWTARLLKHTNMQPYTFDNATSALHIEGAKEVEARKGERGDKVPAFLLAGTPSLAVRQAYSACGNLYTCSGSDAPKLFL